jgi:hypothetical protein
VTIFSETHLVFRDAVLIHLAGILRKREEELNMLTEQRADSEDLQWKVY